MAAREHGIARVMLSDNDIKAESDFYDFAPAPCTCYGCLVPGTLKERMFARVYDNRLVMNLPIAPFLCCTQQICIMDRILTFMYDKPPFRSGPAPAPCCCIPFTCCGPPVIFSYNPKCFCIDMKDYCGSTIQAAPCNLYGCKQCLFCGQPCYTSCAVPVLFGVRNADQFVTDLKGQVDQFKAKHGFDNTEMAIFQFVSDNIEIMGAELGRTQDAPGQARM